MIDRLVLHIGSHKTGSTAIQRSLRDATDLLLERGILYPRTGLRGVGHAQLANELVNTSGPVTAIPSHLGLIEEVRASRPRTLLLSAEGFTNKGSARPAEWVRGLCEALQPQDLRIVGYVRPQWECLESAYADRVRVGMVWVPFAEWLEGALEGESSFDFLRRFAPWREEFAERLETRLYTAPSLTGGDAVDDFWHAVGLGTPPVHRPHHENRIRSGARTIEMLRRLRAFLAEHHLDGLVRVRETLLGAYRRIQAEPIEDLPFSPLTSEDVTRITKRFAPSNEEFVRDYLPGVHGNPLSSPKRDEPSSWSLSEASERERRLFAKLVEEALRQMPLHQLEDVPVAGVADAERRRH